MCSSGKNVVKVNFSNLSSEIYVAQSYYCDYFKNDGYYVIVSIMLK